MEDEINKKDIVIQEFYVKNYQLEEQVQNYDALKDLYEE